jgi:hypothetical protein
MMTAPTIRHQAGIWSVPLDDARSPYPFARMHRRYATLPYYTVAVVDTAKFMACFANEDPNFWVPPAAEWGAMQLARHRDRLAPGTASAEMPIVHIEERPIIRRRLFGLLKRLEMLPVVSFTNGRHRARYLEFAGATTLPVEIELGQLETLLRYCHP